MVRCEQMQFRSPYDMPRDAEQHVQRILNIAGCLLMDAAALSVMPAFALVMLTAGMAWAGDRAWSIQIDHLAVHVLAAISVGCIRACMRYTTLGQEMEIR